MDPFLGEIKLLPWAWAPVGWRLCDGSLLAISANSALFSLLGTQYGGDGTQTFGLPDLRGRTPVHFGTTYPQGAKTGTENVNLLLGNLPTHTHQLRGGSSLGQANLPVGSLAQSNPTTNPHYAPDTTVQQLNPTSVQIAGSGAPHDNMQPFLVLSYCIATVGVYPTRN